MGIRGVTASLLAFAIAVALPIAVASPARAGSNPVLITVARDGSGTCVASTGSLIGNPGSRFTVHNVDCAGQLPYVIVQSTAGAVVGSGTRIANGGSASFTLGTLSGLMIIQAFNAGAPRINVTITDTPIEDPKPHDEFQQVGVPASGDCSDVAPEVGHYPGYPIGGWSKSWAQWINDGTGGPVCTREIELKLDGTVVLIP